MWLEIHCQSGGTHYMHMQHVSTVEDVKNSLAKLEGVAATQQVLMFAGQELEDDALLERDVKIDQYNLADKTTLYMYERLVVSRQIFLTSTHHRTRRIPEYVESMAPLKQVMNLLVLHRLAHAEFPPAAGSIVVKDDAEKTLLVELSAEDSIATVEEKIKMKQGLAPQFLTFYQAYDGCLHCSISGTVAEPEPEVQPEAAPVEEAPKSTAPPENVWAGISLAAIAGN